jgi:hypothetical protein
VTPTTIFARQVASQFLDHDDYRRAGDSVPICAMDIGICSYSFHRLLASGKQDIFGFIRDCQALGCTQLDPWNAHLAVIKQADARRLATLRRRERLSGSRRSAADESGLPWGRWR